MDYNYLNEILPFQANNLIINAYKDELTIIRQIFGMPENKRNLSAKWLECLAEDKACQKHVGGKKQSQEFREKGNEAYRMKNLLVAASHYTTAICAASSHDEQLSLAHANRAQVLLDYGYHEQAHDDCVRALAHGYPRQRQHKILLRQAHCASKMQNKQLLQRHLNELKELQPNAYCTAEIENLQKELLILPNPSFNVKPKTNINRTTVMSANVLGRCLTAREDVPEKSELFDETAYSWVSVGEQSKCAGCLSTLFIPFPCIRCYNQVMYCSLACHDKDAKMHAYECNGYRMTYLYNNVGIGHLALRTLLIGLPEIVHEMQAVGDGSADLLWKSLNNITRTQHAAYAKTLDLASNLHLKPLEDIKYYGLVADLLVQYLRDHTTFLHDMQATSDNWQLVITAILLRHIGQFIINAHKVISLTSTRMPLLQSNLWRSKWHLKPGYLNEFSCIGVVAAANFPHLSMANHACSPSFETAFNGNSVRTYALRNLKETEEIFNSYTLDYRLARKDERQIDLNEYNFICKCEKCIDPKPDSEYELRHQFRCEKCAEIVVPQKVCLSTLLEPFDDIEKLRRSLVVCSMCGKEQQLSWYVKFVELLSNSRSQPTNEDARKQLLQYYLTLEHWLPGNSDLRMRLGELLVDNLFKLIRMDMSFKPEEYNLLVRVTVIYLKISALSHGMFSLEYCRSMTFLWDLVALGRYKCTREHMDSMLNGCTLLSDELRTIFINYYEDYMRKSIM